MKRISCLRDLERYGIGTLTGEACGLSLRILCDTSEQGRKLFAKSFGLPTDIKLADPWNSRVNGQPSVGSVMLGRDDYLTIGVFALLGAGCRSVYRFEPRRDVFEVNKRLVAALREQRLLMPAPGPEEPPRLIDNLWLDSVKKLSDDALSVVPYGSMFSPDTLMGIEDGDAEYLDQYLARAKLDGFDWRSHRENGTAGDRNLHQFTGRVT